MRDPPGELEPKIHTPRFWFLMLPPLAELNLHIPRALVETVVTHLSEWQSVVELHLLVNAVHAAVALLSTCSEPEPLFVAWLESAAEYLDQCHDALDASLARKLLESALLFESIKETTLPLLSPSLQSACEAAVLKGPNEGPAVQLEGVASVAATVPALCDVTAVPSTAGEAIVVADAYATICSTGARVALRMPLQMLAGAHQPLMTGKDKAQCVVAEIMGVHIVELDPGAWACSTEAERHQHVADAIQLCQFSHNAADTNT